jgi:nitrogen fixation NifU-like protein
LNAAHEGYTMNDHTQLVAHVTYSSKVIEESSNPSHMARMQEPDAWGIVRGCCGDTMEIYLRLDKARIVEATFMTDGRESAVASGSMLTKIVQGMSLEEASRVQPEDLIAALGGLPPAKTHCASLAVNALRKAIDSQASIESGE